MREPTEAEFATFAYVQQYLRWHGPRSEELTNIDQLVRAGGESVKFGSPTSWNLYVEGYFTAARELLEGPHDAFFLLFAIYPVLFLYRHYIELELKGVMMAASKLLQVRHPDFSADHDILSLWSKFKTMLPSGHEALKNAANIERILKEMHLIDPRSVDTRYALKRNLINPSVPAPIEINVNNLRDTMDKLHTELGILEVVVEHS
jgi:hypothetical protein